MKNLLYIIERQNTFKGIIVNSSFNNT